MTRQGEDRIICRMRKTLLMSWLIIAAFMGLDAQEWSNLDYNPNQPGLEHNPLKGFMSLWNPGNNFPRSIQGHSFGLNQVMTGMDSFNWSVVETALNNDVSDGNFSTIQFIIDPADGTTRMPSFLIDQVDWILKGGSVPSLCPDWNNETLMQALLSFIEAFGETYNHDPRIFTVTLGLYGMWGEWHVGSDKTFEMTPQNKSRIANAYKKACPDMNLKARYPGPMPDPQVYGYSDGLVFGQSWNFLSQLKEARADQNWKQHVISGEIDPSLQSTLWKSWPNVVGDDVKTVIDSMHPTHLISHYVLTKLYGGTQEWDNAIRAQKMMGYTFYIRNYRLTSAEGRVTVEIEMENSGVAPMHADWEIEIGVLDSSDQFLSLGKTTWNLKRILPDNQAHYRAFSSSEAIDDGIYRVLLRIVNPLEGSSSNADPVRFANNTQDADLSGWITLGEMTLSGGNCGQPPVRVSGISMEEDSITLPLGTSVQLSASVFPENAVRKDVDWYSDHPYTASVDPSGSLTAGPLTGQAAIYASSQDGNHQARVIVNVEPDWQEIPGKIEAEDFVHQSGIQTQDCSDTGGGLNVGWIDAYDWMEYPVRNNSDTVYFTAAFRLSSPNSNGSFRIYLDEDLIGQLNVPNTGGWQNWETVPSNLRIGRGDHILKIAARTGGFNLNFIHFEIEAEPGRNPYKGSKWQFPGDTVDAWKYDYVHFREDGKYFSLDTARTIGIYGCDDGSGVNVRSYSDSADHEDAAQFNWDTAAGTMQLNGQWMEYTAEFKSNMPYQLLLRTRDNVDANFMLSISSPEDVPIFSQDVNLTNDLMFEGSANEQTVWKVSDFTLELPMGVYLIRFDWYDRVGEPGIFGSFSFIETGLDLSPPELILVTTGVFRIGTYLEVFVNEDAKAYLVPSGTVANHDTIAGAAVTVTDITANVKAFISTSGIMAGEYRIYAVDPAGNVSEPSGIIELENAMDADSYLPGIIENISVSHNPTSGSIILKSKNELRRLEIYDITGRKKADADLEGMEASYDLSGLKRGIYLIQVTDIPGNMKRLKILH